MKEVEFLDALEVSLAKYKVKQIDNILEIYKKRFSLGHEAEMDDEEIIDMLGSPDAIARKYSVSETINSIDSDEYNEEVEYEDTQKNSTKKETDEEFPNTKNYILYLSTINFDDVEIVESEELGLHLYYDPKDKALFDKYLDIEETESKLSIKPKTFKIRFNNKLKAKITVGPDVFFKDCLIKNTSTDISICPIYGRKFTLNSTSGDVKIESINVVDASITSVSGDIDIGNLECATLALKNVSGDIDFEDVVTKDIRISTVSGDIYMETLKTNKADFSTISGNIRIDSSDIPSNALHTSRITGDIVLNH